MADYVIVVMSPDFVQRGEGALIDKWVRARMALLAGADLVLELPVRYACASAESFAKGSVSLLSSLGVVDALSFGYEPILPLRDEAMPDPEEVRILKETAAFFAGEETESFRQTLLSLLNTGMTYAQARMEAYLHMQDPESANKKRSLLRSPNNILAVEYLRALHTEPGDLEVIPIPRRGAVYNDLLLPEDQNAFASASAIRSALGRKEDVRSYMPPEAGLLLEQAFSERRTLTLADLDLLMHESLLRKADHLQDYLDVSTDLANRIRNLTGEYTGFESFAALLKTRQITLTRSRRALLHILLGLKKENRPISYARVLGFRKTAGPLLHSISQKSRVPLVTKLPGPGSLPEGLREDLHASMLWEMAVCHKTGKPMPNEYSRQLVIL